MDQYLTYPEVKDALVTSAMKNVDVAVYEYLKSVVDGTVKAGILTATIQNGGVGLAPYHDWESKVPQTVQGQGDRGDQGPEGRHAPDRLQALIAANGRCD